MTLFLFQSSVSFIAYSMLAIEGKLNTLADKPVHFVFGLKDTAITTVDFERWQKHFSKGDVILLQEAGHFTQEDSPESFSFMLRKILKQI